MDEELFITRKGIPATGAIRSSDPYVEAPGDGSMDGNLLGSLSDALRKMSVSGKVSQEMVKPYIDKFPVHVGLEDFDEEPSSRNFTVAMESMAAYLKLGLALAMVGTIGYVIFNLVTSRKKVASITGEEGWRAYLFQQISKSQALLRGSPAWLKPTIVGEGGLNLKNSIIELLSNQPDILAGMEKEGTRWFCQAMYGNLPSFCHMSNVSNVADMVAQTKAIDELQKLLEGAGERIQHGDAGDVIKDIENLREIQPVKRLLDFMISAATPLVGQVQRKPGQSDATYLLEVTEKLEEAYGDVEENGESVVDQLRQSIIELKDFRLSSQGADGAMVGNMALTDSTLRGAVESMEKLKRQARSYKLSSEVESAASEAIHELDLITKSGSRIYDIASSEVKSAFRHARWMAEVYVMILEIAEKIHLDNHESNYAGKLANARKELEKTLKKSL